VIDKTNETKYLKTDTGLQYYDLELGNGHPVKRGQTVHVHTIGMLADGKEFDNSYKRGEPIHFSVGAGKVIPGMDEGVSTMRVGGQRQLLIPPHLGYGPQGAGGVIPPNATLTFEVQVVDAQPTPFPACIFNHRDFPGEVGGMMKTRVQHAQRGPY